MTNVHASADDPQSSGAKILPFTNEQAEPLQNEAAEEEYAAAILADPDALIITRDATSYKEMYHKKPKAVVQAAWACLESATPGASMIITRATIEDRLKALGLWGSPVGAVYLQRLEDTATHTVIEAAVANAGIIRRMYRARKVRDSNLKVAKKVEEDPDKTEYYAETGAKFVMNLLAETAINKRDPSAAAIGAEEEELGEEQVIPCGLAWVDSLCGGYRPGHMYAILGRPKGRKTTFARSLVLRALTEGRTISWFTLDGTRRETRRGFIAMLATIKLWQEGYPREKWRLGIKGIAKMLRTEEERDAILWATSIVDGSGLRIYDGADGIKDLDVLEAKLRRDVLINGTEIFVADYAQKFRYNPPKRSLTDFEHYEASIDRFSTLTTSNNLTSVILSQQNAERLKEGKGGKGGAKYGAAITANTDFQLETEYDDIETPEELTITLSYSRYSGTGEIVYPLDKFSGLILDAKKIA